MPVIDGKVRRSRYTALKLGELSSVDRPAQPGALALCFKRHDPDGDPTQRDVPMSKTVAELEGDLTKALARIDTLNGELTAAQKAVKDAEDAKATMATECDEAKKALAAATDEVISVGGQELRKSVVGDASFSVAKALRDERDMATFEKRAEGEFSHVVGTPAEKALALKGLAALDEDARKAVEAVFASAEQMAKGMFDRIGTGAVPLDPTTKQAVDTFETKVNEVAKRDGISHTDAMTKARREFPAEFAAANG